MSSVVRHGLEGLLDGLSEQQSLRATGALTVGEEARVFLVFGHPLHAVSAGTTGIDAVSAIGAYSLDNPGCSITWTPGLTAGKAHSLAPGERVLERLQSMASRSPATVLAEEERETDRIEDLGLRRLMAAESEGDAQQPNDGNTPWVAVITAVCELLEGTLHRHARGLVEIMRRAEPEPRSILVAIERARAHSIRAVSRGQVDSVLDSAESMVRERIALR